MLALFLCGFSTANANTQSTFNIDDLADSPKWKSLLHLKQGEPQIKDKHFLLSWPNFSPKAELIATLALFEQSPNSAICRFPARFLLLKKYFPAANTLDADIEQCHELAKYLKHVPFESVDLIFASEVVSSASSMMGHTFLRASGKNYKANQVSHSVSFFTQFSTLNPFSLVYDATIGGMEGFFIVRPFTTDKKQYVENEGRNLWQYELAMSDQDKRLMQLHIWELKELDIKYLFQSYNCATLTLYLLSIAQPNIIKEESLFVSPVDVVKSAIKHGLVEKETVTLANEWELKMLESQLPNKSKEQINSFINQGKSIDRTTLDVTTGILTDRYLELLGKINPSIFTNKQLESFNQNSNSKKEPFFVDLTNFKNPARSPQDSAVGVSFGHEKAGNFVKWSFLPASHYLYSDGRQFFNHSELKIGEIIVRADLDNNQLSLDKLTLYSATILSPTSATNAKLSGYFDLSYKPILNKDLQFKKAFELSGAIGKTFSLHSDMSIYGLIGGGLGIHKFDNPYAYVEAKLGAIIETIGDTKLLLEHNISYGQLSVNDVKQTSKVTWSWYGIKNIVASANLISRELNNEHVETAELSFHVMF